MNDLYSLRNKLNTPPTETDHRFVPVEASRSVKSSRAPGQPKLASEVSFSPVTTISTENQSTYVRPVKNSHTRSVSPAVLNQNGQVSIRGERVIELAGALHEQIRAKVEGTVAYKKETLTAPAANPAPLVAPTPPKPARAQAEPLTPEQSTARSLELKQQLEQINQALFEQIRQKISTEIKLQKDQPATVASDQPKPAAFKNPASTASAAATVTQVKPAAQTTALASPPPSAVRTVPVATQPILNQAPSQTATAPVPQPKPVAAEAPAKASAPTTSLRPNPPTAGVLDKDSAQAHIENLEKEISLLSKEIAHIDQTIAQLEKERSSQETAAIEQKLAMDQQMIEAVTDWKYAMTNLVNSHSIALKYLKQKTDWLEDKVENIEGHRAKHEKKHRKPREISLKLESLPKPKPLQTTRTEAKVSLTTEPASLESLKPIVGTVNLVPTKEGDLSTTPPEIAKAVVIEKPAATEIKLNVPSSTATSAAPVVQESISQPPEIKKIIQKEEAKPEQVRAEVEKAIEQKKSELEPKVVEKEVLAEQMVAEKVEKMVEAALSKQQTKLTPSTESSKPAVSGPSIDVAANVVVGAPKVLPGNPEAQININAIPVETSAKPKEDLPTVATGAALSSQSDIERQILESAAREDAAREAVQKAKEEQARKLAEAKSKAAAPIAPPGTTEVKTEVAPETLKNELTKAKETLTTTDNKALAGLSKEDRSQMLRHLQELEHQSEVSRQLDEIKGAAERRKVNTELQAMLERLSIKPQTTAVTTPGAAPAADQTKVESLKIEVKKERSPEEKARLIAEIKDLERAREAKKLEERSRPVVKAQPAYGKMLPNTPTIPNVINGIVKDNKGLLMDTVVVIVKDQNNDPVRAFKTNKIGQFAVSTPLPNGVYTLELEKPGSEFDIIEVEVNGGILPPIEVKAR